MIKEIIVAGIKLYNYSVLENLTQVTKNLEANVFTTIEEVYMKTILLAKEDESVKEVLESLDVTVIAETGILDAVGQATIFRRAEIERREFFLQFMKIMERNGYTVYILGEAEKEVALASQYIADEFSRIKVVGSVALDEIDGERDGIINDINLLAPDVIISVLPSPMQESFIKEYKSMILAKIWYGIGEGKIAGAKLTLGAKIMKLIRKLALKRYIQEDEKTETAESEE
ncbi:MAG: WecB/TagA/CpsF family glycosyltransferase [Agathobacter sp.]|nr:WecB/TagA/CpsF family glycosyltransferase [Agathobacter sp.]